MFLDLSFCDDYGVRIEKIIHMASAISEDHGSLLEEVDFMLQGCENQAVMQPELRKLEAFFEKAYEDNLVQAERQEWLCDNGYDKYIIAELSLHVPGAGGRHLVYALAENELQLRAFAERVVQHYLGDDYWNE